MSALCLLLSGPAWASGGDGFSENAFAPEFHVPEQDMADFAGGKPGVVPASYWRVYQFLAYRALSGEPLSKAEVSALNVRGWSVGPAGSAWDYSSNEEANGVNKWLGARKAIPTAAALKLDVLKGAGDDFSFFINCPSDALERAAQTLAERLKSGGKQWAGVWLANQDAVFANCSPPVAQVKEGQKAKPEPAPVLPAALPPKAPAWLVHDHDYQTAAALFYAGKFDQARERFLAISKNAESPWQPLGGYLAARCLIRKATLQSPPPEPGAKPSNKLRDEMLEKARAELLVQGKTYAPAKKLIGWIDARVRTQPRLAELANLLAAGKVDEQFPGLLSDYLLILDTIDQAAMISSSHPMTAWIGAMQAGTGDEKSGENASKAQQAHKLAQATARKYWREKKQALWLVPLLSNARAGELSADETKAAAAVPWGAPGYHMLQYHLARLAIAEGKADAADAMVSDVLQKPRDTMSVSTRNRWLALKLVTGKTMDEFFQAALREPAEKVQGVPIPNEGAAPAANQNVDADFERQISQHFSLAQLKLAHLRSQQAPKIYLPIAIWTRAVIFGDYATADEFTDELIKGRDTTRHLYLKFKNAKGAAAKRQAAMLIMANAPELNPNGFDAAGSASWCGRAGGVAGPVPELDAAFPNFLSKEARQEAQGEQAKLLALPKRSDYIAPVLLDWARQNPVDPEVPKALHFFVASTRMECSMPSDDPARKAKKNYSREAFELLHARYPKSEWALKTKYYF